MKNCEPPVPGPACAIESEPRLCICFLPLSSSLILKPGPPVPQRAFMSS